MHTDEVREKAATLLAKGFTVQGAARASDVPRRTLHEWLSRDDEFKRLIMTTRHRMMGRTAGKLADMGVRATRAIADLLSGDMPPGIRLKASEVILAQAVKYMETTDLARELAEIKAELAAVRGGDRA